jgi:hypothetical protein
MLVGLVRVSVVAALLGVSNSLCRRYLRNAGVQPARAPLAGRARNGSPWYVSLEGAVRLIDYMLPRTIERLANQRARQHLGAAERELRRSTANLRHEVGGTGSETTPIETGPIALQPKIHHPDSSPLCHPPVPAPTADRNVPSPVPTSQEYDCALEAAVLAGQVLR